MGGCNVIRETVPNIRPRMACRTNERGTQKRLSQDEGNGRGIHRTPKGYTAAECWRSLGIVLWNLSQNDAITQLNLISTYVQDVSARGYSA